MTLFPRSSGVLLHPTSLPGRYGIGDLGEAAYRFVDWLVENGQSIWQVLPLGPTSYGDSPYQTLSAFAGNTTLISIDILKSDGWLTDDDLAGLPEFPEDYVDYWPVIQYHDAVLAKAYQNFLDNAGPGANAERADFCKANAHWLEEFVLYVSIKEENGLRPWSEWPEGLRKRDEDALETARQRLASSISLHRFRQWQFFKQWATLKAYANEKGVRLFGDVPIFIAQDSADVWANQDAYDLDPGTGLPTAVAGVPPDYFSKTGQRWGNPLYRWDVMKERGYKWWIDRFKVTLQTVDYVRIDHFRGFDAYWEVPAEEQTAENGKWVPGPGHHFFEVIREELGELPIIAEDLGLITESVEKLRDDFNLPGMKVLQFAWSDPRNDFLPHNHPVNSVVYTGTHDNNTTVGWWNEELTDEGRQFMSMYLHRGIEDIVYDLFQVGMISPAHTFIMPMQDLLGLGAEARMNTPGTPGGNWQWRMTWEQLHTWANDRLAHLTWLYQRRPDQQEKDYGDTAMTTPRE